MVVYCTSKPCAIQISLVQNEAQWFACLSSQVWACVDLHKASTKKM